MTETSHDELTEEEAARRRDEVLKRMLATPPKPHRKVKTESSQPKAKGDK